MELTNVFDLQGAVIKWEEQNLQSLNLTEEDKKELKDHFLNTIDELRDKGLTDEEAFAVAKIRFGNVEHWGRELKQENDDNFQIKKVINVFFGILIYFILYFGIISFINSLFLGLSNYTESSAITNVARIKTAWNVIYIASFLSIFSLYIFRKRSILFLKGFRMNFSKLFVTFIFFFGLLNLKWYTVPKIANVFKVSVDGRNLLTHYYSYQRNFDYLFPTLICFSFLILFLLYRNKNYV